MILCADISTERPVKSSVPRVNKARQQGPQQDGCLDMLPATPALGVWTSFFRPEFPVTNHEWAT